MQVAMTQFRIILLDGRTECRQLLLNHIFLKKALTEFNFCILLKIPN